MLRNYKYLPLSNNSIGYLGWLGYNNLGDEAMYLSFKRIFSEFKVLPFKRTVKTGFIERVLKKPLYNSCCLGGGTLINSGFIKDIAPAIAQYKKFFIFGAGVRNPEFWKNEHNEDYLQEWKQILKDVKFIGVRGPISKNILDLLGVSSVEIIGDPALYFANDALEKKNNNNCIGLNFGIAKSLLWGGNELVVKKFAINLVKILKKDFKRILFFPVSINDLPYIKKIVIESGLNPQRSIINDFLNLNHYLKQLRQCDVFIGEKLHSVVLAHCLHIPSIMLEYRPKCRDFMASMDMLEFNFRTDQLNEDDVVRSLRKISKHHDMYQEKIFLQTKKYKIKLYETKEKIARYLKD